MKVELRLGGLITLNGRELALGQTFALLEAIAAERSVRSAAEKLSLSYRSAWGRLTTLQEAIGRPVVVKTKGHGTVLTELGEALRQALSETLGRFDTSLAKEQRSLEGRLGALVSRGAAKLRIAASHDPVLMEVLGARSDVEVAILGTEAALDRLLNGQVEVAGCHFGPDSEGDIPPLLRGQGLLATPAFRRGQGLIVARGNPLGLRSVRDIARAKARFINRQRGSGTRAWFDRMLAEEAISPDEIAGYGAEEFTHKAVAAVIASGAADAGLGVREAAESFGLDFVPLGTETYYLARHSGYGSAILDGIVEALRSRSPPGVSSVSEPVARPRDPSPAENGPAPDGRRSA